MGWQGLSLWLLAATVSTTWSDQVSIFRSEDPQIRFGADHVERALEGEGHQVAQAGFGDIGTDTAPVRILLSVDSPAAREWLHRAGGNPVPDLAPQGYAIRITSADERKSYRVIGGDATGAMYGALALAETVALSHGLDSIQESVTAPFIARRGIKFNFPLDARTPSYDDTGDAAQKNIATMWEFDFWEAYLDRMAENRYNVLTLWNPHPFPSLVQLENFPDCALDDVCVTTLKPVFEPGKWDEPQGVTDEILANLRVIKSLSIDDKIAFWRRVMRHARERGIEVYLVTWNVLVNSAAGKYGITSAQDNPKTIEYLRDCVAQTLLTYPDLTGIGVTAGENMRSRSDRFAKEKWLWAAYGEGILDAKRRQPERVVRFIHRHWQTKVADLMAEWGRYPDPFELSFKYARAHLYSSTRPPFARALAREIEPLHLKCWWNLRNDDIFVYRWADPDYVREFLLNLPPAELTAGYYVGSDGYVWGREFTSTEPDSPRALEIDKHWFRFLLWGRLGYDPRLTRRFFQEQIDRRFPQTSGLPLLEAWQAASKIIPLVNRFHWRDWDFMWAVEGCMDQRQGFHSVRDFIHNPTMEGSGLLSIPEFVKRASTGAARSPAFGATPPGVAAELERHARLALTHVAAIRSAIRKPGKELRQTLGDIAAMAHLGNYYAAKIRGALELHRAEAAEAGQAPAHRQAAVKHLEDALEHWRRYSAVSTAQYQPQLLARTRELDWRQLEAEVRKDIDLARTSPPATIQH